MWITLQLEVKQKTLIKVKKLKFDDFHLKNQGISFPGLLSLPGLSFLGPTS